MRAGSLVAIDESSISMLRVSFAIELTSHTDIDEC